jgi:CHAT domain-containing protein
VVDLADMKSIARGISALLRASATPEGDTATATARLRRLLIEPLGLGPEVRRVLVSPFGPMGKTPLALLTDDPAICFVPSGTTWLELLPAGEQRGTRVLALGDPAYGVESPSAPASEARTRWGRHLVPLPATREEAEAVGDVVLLQESATETAVRDLLARGERWRALHFACHALVDVAHPTQSVLAVTPDAENDGFLSVLDILRLRLDCDLAVLSACQTAQGKVYLAEGLDGLTRAFMFAGAPRVLCSLWPVDDEATKTLMVRFYELWSPPDGSEGIGAAAALRQAQAHVRAHEKWAHPYYWAAWVLWGLPD